MADQLLTVNQVAEWTRLDPQTVRRMTRRGEISGAINLGTPNRPIWRYDFADITRWIDGRRQANTTM